MTRPGAPGRTLGALMASVVIAGCGGKAAAPPVAAGDGTQHGHDHDPDHHGAVAPADAEADRDHLPHVDAPLPDAPPPAPPTDAAQVRVDLLAAETEAYRSARPVLERHCGRCHQRGGRQATAKKLGHFDMTTYPFGGHHADELGRVIRAVLGVGGGKPTMPAGRPGVVQGDDLAAIVAWAEAWDLAQAGGAHPPRPAHHHH
ncbi:MAG: hypothetical protein KBG48_20335 [Kofleriaceae bacterium]|nr:hypothetical protein [Kofleriaceae bacterium]MBP9169763.1 hypothetical protein [Kofleriaceae bacterium]MBP9862224.1 hypothetical protein [Kofleriaceae bacterium]